MPGQIVAPVPVSPQRAASSRLQATTSPDFFASLHATLAKSTAAKAGSPNCQQQSENGGSSSSAYYAIPEDDYTVPAPPPPSPVGFRSDHWASVKTTSLPLRH